MEMHVLWWICNHAHMCYLHLRFSGSNTALSSLETRDRTYDVIRGPTLSGVGLYACDSGDLHRGVDGRCEMQRFIPVERERKIENATKQQAS